VKLKRKILVLFLIVWLNLFQPVLIWAQEIPTETPTPTETPITEESLPDEQPTETPTPEPTSAAIIDTGDVVAASENNIDVNKTEQTLPGEAGVCSLDIGCSEVNNQNTAEIGTTTAVEGDSGNNDIGVTTATSAIDTGDVLGLIDGSNDVNQNEIILVGETGPGTTLPTDSSIVNENKAIIDNVDEGNGNSGNNQNNNSGGDATIDTGDVVLVANLVNEINTNQVGSSIKILLANDPVQDKQDLDLNLVWKDLIAEQPDGVTVIDITNQLIAIQNEGEISNMIKLEGNSGENVVNAAEDGIITSGNVTVLANLINLLNINLIGSKIFLGVINVWGETLGDIILPNPEMFANLANNQNWSKEIILQWMNEATIKEDINVNADSGENSASANQSAVIQSGDSKTLVNSDTCVNLNSTGSNWLALNINALGGWEGRVINWESPGAEVAGKSDQFSLTTDTTSETEQKEGTITSINLNKATIYNQMSLSAKSGNNLLSANNASITTGNSTAIANIFNLANLNVWGSNWFWGTINIIGNWKGNAIFAYPDLTVSLNSADSRVRMGDKVKYDISYTNIGYDTAGAAKIELDIPEGAAFDSDNSGLPREISGNKIFWQLKDIEAKEGGNFSVWLTTGRNSQQALGKILWVKPVWAAEAEQELQVLAKISTSQSESDLKNNTGTAATIVWFDSEPEKKNQDEPSPQNDVLRLPKWQIKAKNNVNEFVYPGDVVTFQIEAKNVGEDTAHDSYLLHQIYDTNDTLLRTDTINLGDVEVGKGGEVSFGIKMPVHFDRTAVLKTTTVVVGKNRDGREIRSGEAVTTFVVKVRLVAVAEAKEETVSEVLGVNQTVYEIKLDLLPYVLLFIVSGFWITNQTTRWLKKLKRK